VGQALRDTFLIAHRVADGRFYGDPATPPQDTWTLKLPPWFPSTDATAATQNHGPQFIFCRHNVIEEIGRIGVKKLANVYSQLFTALWDLGRRNKRVSGRITYADMTPPWLRGNVIFIHGENRNASIPFTLKVLPTKNQIKEKNYKFIGKAILDTILRKEDTMAPFLRHILIESGVSVTAIDRSEGATGLPSTEFHNQNPSRASEPNVAAASAIIPPPISAMSVRQIVNADESEPE